jgi:hypothetical protein
VTHNHNPYVSAIITDIHLDSASKNRAHIIYAKLFAADGSLMVAASVDYMLDEHKRNLPQQP